MIKLNPTEKKTLKVVGIIGAIGAIAWLADKYLRTGNGGGGEQQQQQQQQQQPQQQPQQQVTTTQPIDAANLYDPTKQLCYGSNYKRMIVVLQSAINEISLKYNYTTIKVDGLYGNNTLKKVRAYWGKDCVTLNEVMKKLSAVRSSNVTASTFQNSYNYEPTFATP